MADWLALTHVASAPGFENRPVALRGGERLTRQRFLTDVSAWQTTFASHPGRRCALYFDDGYEFAAALFGAWHAGKEVYLPGDTLADTLGRLLPQVDACAGALPGALERVGVCPPVSRVPLDARAARIVIFTSGSSGEPSAIPKKLAQLDAEVHHLQSAFGARVDAAGEATVLTTVSHQHIYGLLFTVLWSLSAGRPFAARRLDYPEEISAGVSRPCVLVSSPAHLRRLSESVDWGLARAMLQAVFSSGGPLPTEAADAALRLLNQSPTEVFGSSETGGIAWRKRAVHGERWCVLPGVQWRIEDGLLAVRSSHLADDDWWTTSDRVEATGGADFVLLGRADRIVKIEEKRVSLTAVERALAACEDIEAVRVLPLPGREGAERLAVVAVLTPAGRERLSTEGKRAFNERLRAVLLQGVERVALPRRWRYVPALPANAQGKVTEAALAALFRPSVPPVQWLSRDDTGATAILDIQADLAVFDGHFPATPILPGVAQLDWAVQFARECFVLPQRFLRVEALKFQRPVPPGTQLELALQWQPAAGVLGFRYGSPAGLHASGRIVFEAAP